MVMPNNEIDQIIDEFIGKQGYKNNPHILGIIVCGSCLTDLYNEKSDIDINIVFDDIIPESGKTYSITEDADGNKVIHRIKPLSEVSSTTESQRVDTLLVKVKWDNDEDYNEIDSEIGSIYGNKISMPIEVSAIQYIGT